MENKFKVLKSGEFWATIAVLIPTIILFFGIMYIFNSPAIAHAAGSARHIKIVSGKTTRLQIFKELGPPNNNIVKSKDMVYDIESNSEIIVKFARPYKTAKDMSDKVRQIELYSNGHQILFKSLTSVCRIGIKNFCGFKINSSF